MQSYSTKQFLQEYELNINEEFCYKGRHAQWAPGFDGPRIWGTEDASIDLNSDEPVKGNRRSIAAALTSDGQYLAVAVNTVIRIYDVDTLALCARLTGHESNVWKMFFVDSRPGSGSSYILLSEGAESSGDDGEIRLWPLDGHGSLSSATRSMPIASHDMASRAMAAIREDLKTHHDFDDTDIDVVHKNFVTTLDIADVRNRGKRVPVVQGQFPGSNSSPISHNGERCLHIIHGDSTQDGLRPADELPQIVVTEIFSHQEICRLRGHQDAIMWAGWSINDRQIATASWDGSYKLWDAETGECSHTIGETGGQNWAGAFLADGSHVLLSGGGPDKVAVYHVETAQKVAHLTPPDSTKLQHWMRYFTVHPKRNLVILQNGLTLLAWTPSTYCQRSSSNAERIFAFHATDDQVKDRYARMPYLKFVDDGNKLVAQSSEGSTFVWDMSLGLKWRFQRPKGLDLINGGDVFLTTRKGAQWVLTLDGDQTLRFWKL